MLRRQAGLLVGHALGLKGGGDDDHGLEHALQAALAVVVPAMVMVMVAQSCKILP